MNTAPVVDATGFDVLCAQGTPLVVCFMATWNRRCQGFMPDYQALAARWSQTAAVVCVDVDESSALAARFEVCSVPTVLLMRGQHVLHRESSLSLAWVEAQLAKLPPPANGV